MKKTKMIMVTGSNGSIGSDICEVLLTNGYKVFGIDLHEKSNNKDINHYMPMDLNAFVSNSNYRSKKIFEINNIKNIRSLHCLINLAGIQHLRTNSFEKEISHLVESLNVNCISPFILTEALKNTISENAGCIINIGSIHSKLTKKNFLHYSTSKGALNSLTKAISIEYGKNIKVIGINPAAIETKMLIDGFESEENLKELSDYHPTKRISSKDEISQLILYLIEKSTQFLNGSIIDMSGGISHCLNDPDNH